MAGCFGGSSYDRYLEAQVNDYCDYDDEQLFNVRLVSANDRFKSKFVEVYAETIEDAWNKVGVPLEYRPKLKNGKFSRAKETFFSPNEKLGWIKIGKKTIGTIELDD